MTMNKFSIRKLLTSKGNSGCDTIVFKTKSAFTFEEAPDTVFLPKSREEGRNQYRICEIDETGRYTGFDNLQSLKDNDNAVEVVVEIFESGKSPELIPVGEFAYIHYAHEDFRLVYMVNTQELYCIPDTMQMPVALTKRRAIELREGECYHSTVVFFPQKQGELPFTPDCRGYLRLEDTGNIKLPHTVCRYRTTTVDFVKESDIRACRRRYLELKSKYKEEPIIHGCMGAVMHSVDEDEWKAYQHRRGYIRMDYQTFMESDFAAKRLDCNIQQLMDAGLQQISIGPAATHYYFIPKHWLKPAGFYTDPNVLKNISKIRKLVATLLDMSPEQQARVKAAIIK